MKRMKTANGPGNEPRARYRVTRYQTLEKGISNMQSIDPNQPEWLPSPLGELMAGDLRPADATILMRSDYATGLLYPGKINVLFGAPESGKSWVALAAALDVAITSERSLEDGATVLVLDYEDSAITFARRLKMMRCRIPTTDHIAHHELDVPLTQIPADLPGLATADLIILDTTNSAMSRMGLDPLSNADANEFMDAVVDLKRMAAPGAAILLIDHEPISTSNERRNAIGAQSKFARIDGVQLRAKVIEQPAPGKNGAIALMITKDREGGLRKHGGKANGESGTQLIATFLMHPRTDDESEILHHEESFTYTIKGPRFEGAKDAERRDEIIAALTDAGKLLSKRQIEGIVGGNKQRLNEIVDAMRDDGEIYAEPKSNYLVFGVVPDHPEESGSGEPPENGNHPEPML